MQMVDLFTVQFIDIAIKLKNCSTIGNIAYEIGNAKTKCSFI